MKSKKIIKISIIIALILSLGILVKANVVATKETNLLGLKDPSALRLELNSELVINLYQSLNMDLINNTCSTDRGCLTNENYNFLYFKNNARTKTLKDEEKLYLIFSRLYSQNKFEINGGENGISTLKIDSNLIDDEIKNFLKEDSKEINKSFKSTNTCGIIDYLYTGSSYELKYKECEEKSEFGLTELVGAYKDKNYINLIVKAVKVKEKIKNKKMTFAIYSYSDDKKIGSVKNLSNFDINKEKDADKYKFSFELSNDQYYLKNISLIA